MTNARRKLIAATVNDRRIARGREPLPLYRIERAMRFVFGGNESPFPRVRNRAQDRPYTLSVAGWLATGGLP